MKRRTLLAAGVTLMTGCVGGDNTASNTPVTNMSIVFEGDHSKDEIRKSVDRVLEFHDIPVNRQNRERVGDIAFVAAEDSQLTEMQVLTCMWGEPPRGAEWSGKWDKVETVAEACVN
jgi:hypothetical protein